MPIAERTQGIHRPESADKTAVKVHWTSVLDLAVLSLKAYDGRNPAPLRYPEGIPPLKDNAAPRAEGWITVIPLTTASKYFSATLFKNVDTGEHTLAFRGTDSAYDIGPDLLIGLGQVPGFQYHLARNALIDVRNAIGTTRVYLTGHSLGGGLASIMAAREDLPAVTFNAPGMTRAFLASYRSFGEGAARWFRSDSSKQLHVRAEGDPISLIAGPRLGTVRTVRNADCYNQALRDTLAPHPPPAAFAWSYGLCTHSMKNLVAVLATIPDLHSPLRWL